MSKMKPELDSGNLTDAWEQRKLRLSMLDCRPHNTGQIIEGIT
jgi:hypothetical protein